MLFLIPILTLLFFYLLMLLYKYYTYSKSDYKITSSNNFFKTVFDKGYYGEFLTFSYLEKLDDTNKKLMVNLYIPKEDGTTTEIDLIMVTETGIYVFESKNYSGWIFGDEKYKNWTQSLKGGHKNKFFNPIWQNKGHIKALQSVLGIHNFELYKSYIIFSERCELKNISITSPNAKVIKRNSLIDTIKKDIENSSRLLSIEKINQIYLKLQEFAYVDESIKEEHIKRIKGLE